MKIYPLLLALLLAAAMVAARALGEGFDLPRGPFVWPGLALMVAGALLVLWSAGIFRRHDTTLNPQGKPSALATQGLYRWSRNPMYLGMLLGLLGLALLLGNVLQLAGPVLFAAITARQIRHEEAVLEQCFGADYLNYKSRVRRWF